MVACVVEGHGDAMALPIVVRRLAESYGEYGLGVHAHRVPRSKMLDAAGRVGAELERALVLQGDRVGEDGLVIVLLDSDDDDADTLTRTIERAHCGSALVVVAAVREYEAWFLAALPSLRHHPAVHDDAQFDGDPESPRDAKGELALRMSVPYQVTIHQPAFSASMSLTEARKASRFSAFAAVVMQWIDAGQAGSDAS